MPLIVEDLAKRFGPTAALRGVSLDLADGEFLALLGPSGSGKTTLLRILAGLAQPSAGAVRYGGEDLLALKPRARRAGMVFQHYALFRHMTVAGNVGFGLSARPRAERPSRAEIAKRVEELLVLVQLEGFGGRYPGELSGGQQQRVALARALAIEPRLLLLDEPFGALDAPVRRDLRRWLRRVHDETGVTTVFVTHDQEEALDLADKVAILRDGAIEQAGAPDELYARPANPFVFEFLGPSNRMDGQVRGGVLELGEARLEAPGEPDGAASVYFRPHDVAVNPLDGAGFACRLDAVVARGPAARLTCSRDGHSLEVELEPVVAASLSRGDQIRLAPRRFTLFRG